MSVQETNGYLDVENATLRSSKVEVTSNLGIANTNPQHAFSVGSNLFIDTESSNVLTIKGNVLTEGVKVGLIEIIPSYDFAAVSNVGNVTQSTIQFSNATTAFVTTANIEVGTANLFVDTVTGRVGIGKTDPGAALDVVGDVEISSNLAVSGSKFTYDNTNTTVFTGTTSAAANEIGYLDMSTSSSSNNIHVKVYIKYGQSSALGDAEYSFYIRPNSANFSLIYDYRNQNGPITPVVYRTNANDLWSGGTPGVVRFGYSIASAQNVIWRVEVQQRSGSATFYPTNTGSAVDTTGLVQVTPAPFTRFDSNVAVSGNVGIGTTDPKQLLEVNSTGYGLFSGRLGVGNVLTSAQNGGGQDIWNLGTSANLLVRCLNNANPASTYANARAYAGIALVPGFDASDTTNMGLWGSSSGENPVFYIQGQVNNGNNGGGRIALQPVGGNVGIGTTNPSQPLDVYTGTANFQGIQVRTGTTPAAFAKLITNPTTGGHNGIVQAGDLGIVFSPDNSATTDASPKGFYIAPWSSGTTGLRINDNGNVGIGTTNPQAKLHVSGTMLSSLNASGANYSFYDTLGSDSAWRTAFSVGSTAIGLFSVLSYNAGYSQVNAIWYYQYKSGGTTGGVVRIAGSSSPDFRMTGQTVEHNGNGATHYTQLRVFPFVI